MQIYLVELKSLEKELGDRMKYIIGLDNGGTGVKAVLFDLEGNEISNAYEKISIISERPYFVERDIEEVWQKNLKVIMDVISKSGINPKEIIAIGQSGHGKGIYLLGKNDKIICRAIHSNDSRANTLVNDIKNSQIIEEFYKNYQNPGTSQIPILLKWLKENTQILDEVEFILGVKDFIGHKLTGSYHHEITDLSSSAMVNFSDLSLNTSLLEKLGLSFIIDKFSDIISSESVYGNISEEISKQTGLSRDCLVVAGIFDISACSIAMGITDDTNMSLIGGTWSINGFIFKSPLFDKTTTQNSIYCLDSYYFIEESSPTSASNNEWFINTFLKDKDEAYKYVNKLVESSSIDLNGPIYCPFLYGSNYNRLAKAGLLDINSSNDLGDILRSIYEGIAFAHKVHINKLLEYKKDFNAIRVGGGITNSDIWLQIFADILDMPLEIIDKKELGAFGAAICAGVSAGIYNNFIDACKTMVRVSRRIEVNKANAALYRRKFQKYLQAAELIDKL